VDRNGYWMYGQAAAAGRLIRSNGRTRGRWETEIAAKFNQTESRSNCISRKKGVWMQQTVTRLLDGEQNGWQLWVTREHSRGREMNGNEVALVAGEGVATRWQTYIREWNLSSFSSYTDYQLVWERLLMCTCVAHMSWRKNERRRAA
jgi:hypothetical protein